MQNPPEGWVARDDERDLAAPPADECHAYGIVRCDDRHVMQENEFKALVTRLERASDVLYDGGSLMQSLARRYYVVYTYAVQAAEKYALRFRRGVAVDEGRRITHEALPDLVHALYSGQNVRAVLGSGPRRRSHWAIDRCRCGAIRWRPTT